MQHHHAAMHPPQRHAQKRDAPSGSHIGTALLLLAACVRSIGPMHDATLVGSDSHVHVDAPMPSAETVASAASSLAPHLSYAYASANGLEATVRVTQSGVYAAGGCGTDVEFTVGSDADPSSGAGSTPNEPLLSADSDAYERISNGPRSLTNDAVALASGDDEEDDEDERQRRIAARRAARRAASSPAASRRSASASSADAARSLRSTPTSKVASFAGSASGSGSSTPAAAGRGVAHAAVASIVTAAIASESSTTQKAPRRTLRSLPQAVLRDVVAMLPLEDLDAARAASAPLAEAAAAVAPEALGTDGDMVFFRWQPQELKTRSLDVRTHRRGGKGARKAAAVAETVPFEWRCVACSQVTNGNKACTHCHTETSAGACRVFVGQLRKAMTAELLSHLIAWAAPNVTVRHIEAHTIAGSVHRSKGCAWVYLDTTADAVALTAALHRRAFVDVDADGGEGVWYVRRVAADADGALQQQERLAAFAAERLEQSESGDASGAERWHAVMPRQPVVAEIPAKSLLAALALEAFDA